jgi:biofilm PGA synthesis N-glycosyltransferase PgaC
MPMVPPMAPPPLRQSPRLETDRAAGSDVFRASASFPLPRFRPVPEFVALPAPRRYVTVAAKFHLALAAAAVWLALAIVGGWITVSAIDHVAPWPIGIVLFAFVVAVPGAVVTFMAAGLLLDDPPTPTTTRPTVPVTVAITARNQPRSVVETLAAVHTQDYDGPLTIVLLDNGSSDATVDEARRAAARLGVALRVLGERRVGVVPARNAALACADTPLLVVVEAGVVLHPSAVRLLVARLLRSPADTAAVSAHAVQRNARTGDVAEAIAAEYSLQTHAIRRIHGLFQAPLVAESACMLFRTDAVRAVDGWPRGDADGIELTWQFQQRGWRVFHEPLALAFATGPVTSGSWATRRVRAANVLAEKLRAERRARTRPGHVVSVISAVAPLTEGVFCGGMVLALALVPMGAPALLAAYVVLVLPVSLAAGLVARAKAGRSLEEAGLTLPDLQHAWLALVLGLHAVQAALGAGCALAHLCGRVDE